MQAPSCRVLMEIPGGAGRTELAFPQCPELHRGWTVRVDGRLRRPRPSPHPLLPGSARRLARRGCWTRLSVEELQVLRRAATPIGDLRRRIALRLLEAAGPERGALLAALVLGGAVAPPPAELRQAFQAAGLSHALAASGFHLSVWLGAVMALARGLGRGPRLLLATGALGLFVLLAGPQPSVVRAALMGGTAFVALESGWRTRPLGLLALTAGLMLLWRPDWLLDVGFQLSVAATAGLVVSAGPLEQGLKSRWPAWMLPGWTAAALAVPLAASLWTLPLQLLHFGALPLYAVPANLLATPLLTPLTLAAMAAAALAVLLPGMLTPLMAPINLMAATLLALVRGVAALPMALWQSGRPQPLLVALLALGLLGWVLPALARRWRWLASALLVAVMLVHLGRLGGDRLLLVHEGGGRSGRDLLVARHQGRAALISSRSDDFSCRRTAQLARGLGVGRFDWLLLMDAVPPPDPDCWRRQTTLMVGEGADVRLLMAGQRLESPGLALEALSMDSHALVLSLGKARWLLLPDRQALWAWQQDSGRRAGGIWLGFQPDGAERQWVMAAGPREVWLSGRPRIARLPRGWRASGAIGSLQSGDG